MKRFTLQISNGVRIVKDKINITIDPIMSEEEKHASIDRLAQEATDRVMKGISELSIPNEVAMQYMTAWNQAIEKQPLPQQED